MRIAELKTHHVEKREYLYAEFLNAVYHYQRAIMYPKTDIVDINWADGGVSLVSKLTRHNKSFNTWTNIRVTGGVKYREFRVRHEIPVETGVSLTMLIIRSGVFTV